MRRKYVYGCALALLAGSLAAAWMVRPTHTPPMQQIIAKTTVENQPSLPLAQVVLFSSGVGYFQREGEVEGNARVDLQFPLGDVNDLLKSVVLQDLGKGKIGVISYDGLDPVDKTLRSFAVDLTGNPTVGELLNQARGEKVEVVMQATAANQPGTLTGVVMGMEAEMQPRGTGPAAEVHMLNLVCAEGVRSVNMREIQRVRFLNPRLEGELRKALDVLANSHDTLKKQVSLNFKGEGKRKVRVGYVAENPIWKTSYRLSVDDLKGQAKPKVQLQGWAAVENVTDEDWNDVRVVLVAGRPISFQMDLYPPLFVPRPTVEPETFASLRSPSYGGALTRGKVEEMMAGAAAKSPFNGPVPALPGIGGIGGIGGLGGGLGGVATQPTTNLGWQGNIGNVGFIGGGGFQGQANLPVNRYQNRTRANPQPGGGMMDEENTELTPVRPSRLTYEQWKARQQGKQEAKTEGEKIANLDPHGQLAAEAAAEDLGTHVRYVIDERVSLPRQKSALLPLLDKSIEATRVTIFNEAVHSKFPVLGLRLKNTSGQPLTQGPVTVYEEGGYAGDARLPDLQPSEERLLSYAIDLGTEVKAESRHSEGPAMTAIVLGDRLHLNYTARDTHKYTIRNRSPHDRLLIIEHPVRNGWELAGGAKPRETSRDVYRFDVPVAAGQDVTFEVAEEQPRTEQSAGQAQTNKDGARVVFFSTGVGVHVELTSRDAGPQIMKARVAKGELLVTSHWRVPQAYRVINTSATEAREVTLQHRLGQGWRIAGEQPADAKDFPLKLGPGKDGRAEVVNEREATTTAALATISMAELEKMLKESALSAGVKAVLKKVLDGRAALAEESAQSVDINRRLREIAEEQDRLRKNLASLPPTSAAHKRYLEKFDKQETEIEGLQEQLKKLKAGEQQKQKELVELLPTLNAE